MKPELSVVDPPAASICPNCGAQVGGNYCSNCGQQTVLHPASTREFLQEFIGHHVALESRLWGTLFRLLFRPGALTNEYIQGRRVRFVQPLRLYLTLSVLFFALIKFTNGVDTSGAEARPKAAPAVKVARLAPPRPAAAAAPKPAIAAATADDDDGDQDLDSASDQVIGWLRGVWPEGARRMQHFGKLNGEEKKKVLKDGFYDFAPYALFCLMPVFALYLKMLYLGSGRRFGEHLLFALHANAFAFAVLMLTMLPVHGLLKFPLWIWLIGYLPWAMRRVYGGSRFGTAWRWMTLTLLHLISIGVAFLFALSAGVLAAG